MRKTFYIILSAVSLIVTPLYADVTDVNKANPTPPPSVITTTTTPLPAFQGQHGIDFLNDTPRNDKYNALPEALPDNVIPGAKKILPDIVMKVRVSYSEQNRIICDGRMDDAVSSDEKPYEILHTPGNAWLKFKYLREGDMLIYPKSPVDLAIPCNGQVYTIIAFPDDLPMQVIRLGSGLSDKMKKNLALNQGKSSNKQIMDLMKAAILGEIPPSYDEKGRDRVVDIFNEISLHHIRTIDVVGQGYYLDEYLVTLKPASDNLELDERQFINPELIQHQVRGIQIYPSGPLRQGQAARLHIVQSRVKELTNESH